MNARSGGFLPPVYPYEKLEPLRTAASLLSGGAIDCSVGNPCDPPPSLVVEALAGSGSERGYPPSVGTTEYLQTAADWMRRRFGTTFVFGLEDDPADPAGSADSGARLAACVGTKEFVVSLPHYLRLRRPDLDTVLYPAVSYPSYAMGAVLAGCRAVPVEMDRRFRVELSSVSESDARRALCLWVNTPGNPAGGLDDLEAAAAWGRQRGVPVISDECYVEFTWDGPAQTILSSGSSGVLALHSLSKRSNMAGIRAGFYVGDADLVHYLSEVRKHAGALVPGPSQAAAAAALGDQRHVERQRRVYRRRLEILLEIASASGAEATLPAGGFYLWARAPDGDAWAYAQRLASRLGIVASPGEFYTDLPPVSGPYDTGDPRGFVRLAAVQPAERLQLALERL